MHEGRKQTNTWSAYAGSRLELSDALGRRRPKRHPSSRTGENPPYGMIGGIEETSASFEGRSAPRSYPTLTFGPSAIQSCPEAFFPSTFPRIPDSDDALPSAGPAKPGQSVLAGCPAFAGKIVELRTQCQLHRPLQSTGPPMALKFLRMLV